MPNRLLGVEAVGGLSVPLLEELEGLEVVPGERDLSKSRLRFIQDLVESATFNRCEWGTCHCLEDGKVYRVNGQHSSTVLRNVLEGKLEGLVFPEGVPVTIARYECETLRDLADVFDQFDQHKSVRKPEDKLGIFMAQHPDLVGIDKKICGKVLAGVEWGTRHVPAITKLCEGYLPSEAYDRGLLLNVDPVREFIDLMHQHAGAPFDEWQQKTGIIARFFCLFIEDTEMAELSIEQLLYEAGDSAAKFTREIRNACARTGKDQGYYYRKTQKYFKDATEFIKTKGRDEVKALIREVMAEDDEPSEEMVDATA